MSRKRSNRPQLVSVELRENSLGKTFSTCETKGAWNLLEVIAKSENDIIVINRVSTY